MAIYSAYNLSLVMRKKAQTSANVSLNNRSAITNGARQFHKHERVSYRQPEARRWRDLFRFAMEACGGRHEQLARCYATLAVERERLDAAAARGEPVDSWALVRLANSIARLEERLGIGEPNQDEQQERILREDREAGLA